MTTKELNVTLADILNAISVRQPVLNIDKISDVQLQKRITGVGSLNEATSSQLSFLSDKSYASFLPNSNAAVVLVRPDSANDVADSSIAIEVDSPYLAYASTTQLFQTSGNQVSTTSNSFIHPTAFVSESAELGERVHVGAFCFIGDHAKIGEGTYLKSYVHVDDFVTVGSDCVIFPHVYIGHHCQIGDHVRLHPNVTIGAEGFGFAPMPDTATEGWERIAQLGRVIIGNGVRIGSSTCVDRGAINDTVIEDNVIIDNLVQVGHNVRIGAGTAIAANAGIAGSAVIGKRCMIGGGVGIAGHLRVADEVVLTGMTMVSKSITEKGVYSSGVHSMPAMDWRRVMVKLRSIGKKVN